MLIDSPLFMAAGHVNNAPASLCLSTEAKTLSNLQWIPKAFR
jgi:hypothetical protein